MESANVEMWLVSIRDSVASYRRMIDATIDQLTDSELRARPSPDVNSVAVILRHLGGNLRSRWTDFLTTDGEKPNRDRDSEFQDWDGDRSSLMRHFDAGWDALTRALESINDDNITTTIYIRGEPHSIPQAMVRSVTHLAYHAGQIALIARVVHHGDWQWLTIAPGSSAEHNEQTWGTTASRSIFSQRKSSD